MTGPSLLSAVMSRPLASAGVLGMITARPGTWANMACRLWECCAAWPQPRPMIARIVSGTLSLPPDM